MKLLRILSSHLVSETFFVGLKVSQPIQQSAVTCLSTYNNHSRLYMIESTLVNHFNIELPNFVDP